MNKCSRVYKRYTICPEKERRLFWAFIFGKNNMTNWVYQTIVLKTCP